VFPNNKGRSFGLTKVAIFIGALPTILGTNLWLKNDIIVLSVILLAAAVLFAVLRFMLKLKTLKA